MNLFKLSSLMLAGLFLFGSAYAIQDKEPPKPAETPKESPKETPKDKPAEKPADTVAELGKPAPDFTLTDMNGKTVQLASYKGKIVVLEWFQPSCPYCVSGYESGGNCLTTGEKLAKEGVVWLLINSNHAGHPDSKVEANIEFFKSRKLEKHTVLMDTDGKVGRSYGAKSTPHCFVIDEKGNLAYRGAIDNTPRGKPAEGEKAINYVEAAVAEIKAKKPVSRPDTKAYG
jgi:peroxiredoxin